VIIKSKKIRLELNNKQRTMALQHAGVARHAYNWGLDVCLEAFKNKEKMPSSIDLHKKLVAEVKKENPWYYESSKCAPQEALRNLDMGYKNFHRLQKKHDYKKIKEIKKNGVVVGKVFEGLPKYKKRGVNESFFLEDPNFLHVNNNKIKVPRIGWLKCSEVLPEGIKIKNVTISRRADDWFVSFYWKSEKANTEKTKEEN